METPPITTRIVDFKSGYRHDDRLISVANAVTYLPDGTPVHIKGQVAHQSPSEFGRKWQAPEARVYVDVPDETILDHLINRRNRPWTEWKRHLMPTVIDALPALQGALYRFPDTTDPYPFLYPTFLLPEEIKVRWSQKAGCNMCSCSPGFILTDVRGFYGTEVSFFIKVGTND